MIAYLKQLFRHKHKPCQILGHTESDLGIRVFFKCECGRVFSKRFRENDPYIDEESQPKCKWSGYTWWMHDELKSAKIERFTCQK